MDVFSESWLDRAARLHPDRLAIDAPDGAFTYAELQLAASSLRLDLNQLHGLMPHDEVAIDLPPSAGFAIALHACLTPNDWLTGRPIDQRLPAATRAERLAGCDATVTAETIATYLPVEPGLIERTGGAGASYELHGDNDPTIPWPPDAAPAVRLWTSGSTGPGTEVRLSPAALLWNALGSAAALGQPPNERWLSAMPVAHVGGLTVLTRSAIGATTAVLRPRFDVDEQVALLMAGEATITSVVPTMLRRMLDAGLEHPPNLRLVLLGGAPITPDLVDRAAAAGVPIASTYGMTEACSQVFTAGAPLFCTEVALRGEIASRVGGEDAAHPDEILVKGPTLAQGVAGPDGWFATGDRGARATDGTFSVIGRVAETIITGGENVAPTEVEAHLLAQPGIADAAVLGIPDPDWGERLEARVVLDPGVALDEARVRAALRDVLPPFAVPKAITVVDALPRTPTGKLRRRDLR